MMNSTLASDQMRDALNETRIQAKSWAALSVKARCVRLAHLRELLARDAGLLAQIVTEEIGKPPQESYGADILPSIDSLEWLCKTAPKHLRDETTKAGKMSALPLGVVGVIGTWNYPVFLNITPIAWTLAAGNGVLWKPSEFAEKTAGLLETYFEEAGLPVAVLYGGGDMGQELCRVGVDKVCFTGGVSTGRAILETLAETGTPSVMELSGNDAMLVLEDADPLLAARSAVWGRCCNAGQSCVAPQRIYVHKTHYDRFLSLCLKEIEVLRPDVEIVAMRTEALRNRVHRIVSESLAQGARAVTGKNASSEMDCFYPPTLLAECEETMPVMAEDFFGPVLAVCSVKNDAEAIEKANSAEMALAASVWTGNRAHGESVAAELRVGIVSINEVLIDAADPEIAFGGLRSSGFGKQRGVAGLEEFVVWKTVTYRKERKLRRHLFPYPPGTPEILHALIGIKVAKTPKEKLAAGMAMTRAVIKLKKKDGESVQR